jgi:predicted transcriptional regulator
MSGSISPPLLETVARRAPVIERLLESSTDKRDLQAELDVSRTTVSRALDSLEDEGVLARRGGEWTVTLFGKYVYREYERLRDRFDDVSAAKPLLDHFSIDARLDARALTDADVFVSEQPAPHAPLYRLEELLADSEQVNVISRVVLPKYVQLIHEHGVGRTTQIDLVLGRETVEYLWANYADELDDLLRADDCVTRRTGDAPSFALVVIDETTTWLGVHDESGGLRGAIVNDADSAVSWATDLFYEYRQTSESVPIPEETS